MFKGINKTLAAVVLLSISMSVVIAVVNSLNNIAALLALGNTDYMNVFAQEQRSAILMLFLRLNNYGQGLLELFWTPYLFALGLLIIKSKYLPKIIGILLIIMSVGFLVNTFTKLLIPQFYPATFTRLAMFGGALGGIPTILWLLIKGVKEPRETG